MRFDGNQHFIKTKSKQTQKKRNKQRNEEFKLEKKER